MTTFRVSTPTKRSLLLLVAPLVVTAGLVSPFVWSAIQSLHSHSSRGSASIPVGRWSDEDHALAGSETQNIFVDAPQFTDKLPLDFGMRGRSSGEYAVLSGAEAVRTKILGAEVWMFQIHWPRSEPVRINSLTLRSDLSIEPSAIETNAPSSVGFRVLLTNEQPSLRFKVVDAETMKGIDDFEPAVWRGRILDQNRILSDWDSTSYVGVSPTRSTHWLIRRSGYQIAFGDGTEAQLGSDGKSWVVAVNLRRGWGEQFRVEDDDQNPLVGVLVHLDHELAGATNEDGILRVNRSSRPSRCDLEYHHWRVTWGGVTPTGALTEDSSRGRVVRMAPP